VDLEVADPGNLANIDPKLQQHFRDAQILLRPVGNTLLPPYCVTLDDLTAVYDSILAIPN
jgi:adenosylmethionine---8-amino-7-oxononanoate aminotransferase